jgi:hypothetical protein
MIKFQNVKKWKNCLKSGAQAFGCPRHVLVWRMADLERGEVYVMPFLIVKLVLKFTDSQLVITFLLMR